MWPNLLAFMLGFVWAFLFGDEHDIILDLYTLSFFMSGVLIVSFERALFFGPKFVSVMVFLRICVVCNFVFVSRMLLVFM